VNIDVVIVTSESAPDSGRVIVASTADQLVTAVRRRLPTGASIDRLRIIDSWDGPARKHPLKATSKLSALRPLFSPAGQVRIIAGPAPAVSGSPGSVQESGFGGGFQGNFGGGFGGAGRIGSIGAARKISFTQLSAALGVPVKAG
jgi:hypothetical protein